MTDQCRRCEGCERDHCECLIQRMADEIELLQARVVELEQAIAAEREACAKVAENHRTCTAVVASAIRARGKKP